ncbi:immunoglobulin domain-containing protein, partial [Opitutales bacterium]|nr:immunoglobulin domain-containing protein [Opitutales bacterium]
MRVLHYLLFFSSSIAAVAASATSFTEFCDDIGINTEDLQYAAQHGSILEYGYGKFHQVGRIAESFARVTHTQGNGSDMQVYIGDNWSDTSLALTVNTVDTNPARVLLRNNSLFYLGGASFTGYPQRSNMVFREYNASLAKVYEHTFFDDGYSWDASLDIYQSSVLAAYRNQHSYYAALYDTASNSLGDLHLVLDDEVYGTIAQPNSCLVSSNEMAVAFYDNRSSGTGTFVLSFAIYNFQTRSTRYHEIGNSLRNPHLYDSSISSNQEITAAVWAYEGSDTPFELTISVFNGSGDKISKFRGNVSQGDARSNTPSPQIFVTKDSKILLAYGKNGGFNGESKLVLYEANGNLLWQSNFYDSTSVFSNGMFLDTGRHGFDYDDVEDVLYYNYVSQHGSSLTQRMIGLTIEGDEVRIHGSLGSPSIGVELVSQDVIVGDRVTFQANAIGEEILVDPGEIQPVPAYLAGTEVLDNIQSRLSYEWYKDDVLIDGENSDLLTLDIVTSGDQGQYHYKVTNHLGSVTSNTATLSVEASVTVPGIDTHPTTRSVSSGSTVTLSVSASGESLSYQWQKGGVAIAGATSASYTLSSVSASDAGSYTVVVSNSAGGVTSNAATLTVESALSAPVITAQPTGSAALAAGSSYTLNVSANGNSLSYQWQKGGIDIAGATSASYTLSSVSASDAGAYTVVVSNSAGRVTSNAAALSVEDLSGPGVEVPSIDTQPISQSVTSGDNVTLSVSARGGSLSYQWQTYLPPAGWQDIQGATSSNYTATYNAISDGGAFKVVISNSAGSVASEPVQVLVDDLSKSYTLYGEVAMTWSEAISYAKSQGGYLLELNSYGEWLSVVEFLENSFAAMSVDARNEFFDNSYALSGGEAAYLWLGGSDAAVEGEWRWASSNEQFWSGGVNGTAVDGAFNRWGKTTQQNEPDDNGNQDALALALETWPWVDLGLGFELGSAYQWNDISADDQLYFIIEKDLGGPAVEVPSISTHPTSQSVTSGSSVTLSVSASGESLSYQWQEGGVTIAGGTSSSYTLPGVSVNDAGSYTVVVSNSAGSVTSNAATLSVEASNPAPASLAGKSFILSPSSGGSKSVPDQVTFTADTVNFGFSGNLLESDSYSYSDGTVTYDGEEVIQFTYTSSTGGTYEEGYDEGFGFSAERTGTFVESNISLSLQTNWQRSEIMNTDLSTDYWQIGATSGDSVAYNDGELNFIFDQANIDLITGYPDDQEIEISYAGALPLDEDWQIVIDDTNVSGSVNGFSMGYQLEVEGFFDCEFGFGDGADGQREVYFYADSGSEDASYFAYQSSVDDPRILNGLNFRIQHQASSRELIYSYQPDEVSDWTELARINLSTGAAIGLSGNGTLTGQLPSSSQNLFFAVDIDKYSTEATPIENIEIGGIEIGSYTPLPSWELYDDFSGSVLDTQKWETWYWPGGSEPSVNFGKLNLINSGGTAKKTLSLESELAAAGLDFTGGTYHSGVLFTDPSIIGVEADLYLPVGTPLNSGVLIDFFEKVSSTEVRSAGVELGYWDDDLGGGYPELWYNKTYYSNGSENISETTQYNVSLGQSYRVRVLRQDGQIKLYRDDILVATHPAEGEIIGIILVAFNEDGQSMTATVDNVRVLRNTTSEPPLPVVESSGNTDLLEDDSGYYAGNADTPLLFSGRRVSRSYPGAGFTALGVDLVNGAYRVVLYNGSQYYAANFSLNGSNSSTWAVVANVRAEEVNLQQDLDSDGYVGIAPPASLAGKAYQFSIGGDDALSVPLELVFGSATYNEGFAGSLLDPNQSYTYANGVVTTDGGDELRLTFTSATAGSFEYWELDYGEFYLEDVGTFNEVTPSLVLKNDWQRTETMYSPLSTNYWNVWRRSVDSVANNAGELNFLFAGGGEDDYPEIDIEYGRTLPLDENWQVVLNDAYGNSSLDDFEFELELGFDGQGYEFECELEFEGSIFDGMRIDAFYSMIQGDITVGAGPIDPITGLPPGSGIIPLDHALEDVATYRSGYASVSTVEDPRIQANVSLRITHNANSRELRFEYQPGDANGWSELARLNLETGAFESIYNSYGEGFSGQSLNPTERLSLEIEAESNQMTQLGDLKIGGIEIGSYTPPPPPASPESLVNYKLVGQFTEGTDIYRHDFFFTGSTTVQSHYFVESSDPSDVDVWSEETYEYTKTGTTTGTIAITSSTGETVDVYLEFGSATTGTAIANGLNGNPPNSA